MGRTISVVSVLIAALALGATAQETFETDIIKTSAGDLKITFIGHGTLMFTFGGKVIHVDPCTREADYSKLPKADLILVTHEHGDHLDPKAIDAVRRRTTSSTCAAAGSRTIRKGTGTVM